MKNLERILLAASLVFLLGLAGCSLYVVKQSSARGQHHGIPFYVKAASCEHKVVYLEPYYVLTLTAKEGDKVVSVESTTLSLSGYDPGEVAALRAAVLASKDTGDPGGQIRTLWKKLQAKHSDPQHDEAKVDPKDWFRASDTVVASVYVDYSTPYTLNVRKPLIGTAQANTKLAPDGTLTEAQAQAEDKTLSTILEMIPAKELIKGAAAVAAFDGSKALTKISLELAIEPRAVSFARQYHIADLKPPCEAASDEQRKDTVTVDGKVVARPYDLVVEDVGGDKKPKPESGIKVDATITLPKPEPKKD